MFATCWDKQAYVLPAVCVHHSHSHTQDVTLEKWHAAGLCVYRTPFATTALQDAVSPCQQHHTSRVYGDSWRHPLPCVCFKLALFRSQHHRSVIWGVLHIQLSCAAGCAIQVCIGHYHTQQWTQHICLSQEVVTSVNDGCPGHLSCMPRAFL